MRLFILFTIYLSSAFSDVQSQTVKHQICGHAWQQKPAASIWNFEENGDFTVILFWANKKNSGFIAKKWKFSLNDSTKTMKVYFDSTYGVYSEDSFSVSKDIHLQKWHLLSVTDHRIVLSRPTIWQFENKNIDDGSKNIIVTLVAGKKTRSNLKT